MGHMNKIKLSATRNRRMLGKTASFRENCKHYNLFFFLYVLLFQTLKWLYKLFVSSSHTKALYCIHKNKFIRVGTGCYEAMQDQNVHNVSSHRTSLSPLHSFFPASLGQTASVVQPRSYSE